MLPGPDQIIACPKCQALAKYMTLRSGNTFGARLWTDGKRAAPMLPLPPEVVKCQHCGECYWLEVADKVGRLGLTPLTVYVYGDRAIDPAWAAAQTVQQPTEEEYYQAIEKGLAANTRQERTLRVLAWWRRNDAYRHAKKKKAEAQNSVTVSTLCRANLEALGPLLNEADDDGCLMKAEVLRELGEFESAEQVLSLIVSAKYAEYARQLRVLCDAADIRVRALEISA